MAYIAEQLSLFDTNEEHHPGEWIDAPGDEMTFQQASQMVGKLIVMDYSTESHKWYKVCRLERVSDCENGRRLILYDGKPQRGLADEMYFNKDLRFHYRAYLLPEE